MLDDDVEGSYAHSLLRKRDRDDRALESLDLDRHRLLTVRDVLDDQSVRARRQVEEHGGARRVRQRPPSECPEGDDGARDRRTALGIDEPSDDAAQVFEPDRVDVLGECEVRCDGGRQGCA